jgi:hypothetical protein
MHKICVDLFQVVPVMESALVHLTGKHLSDASRQPEMAMCTCMGNGS